MRYCFLLFFIDFQGFVSALIVFHCFTLLLIAFHCFQVSVVSTPRGTTNTYIDDCMGRGERGRRGGGTAGGGEGKQI